MRSHFVPALLCTLALSARVHAQEKVNIGHAASKEISIRLTGPFNDLRIIGWSNDSVAITGQLMKGYKLNNVFAGDPGVPSAGAKLYIESPDVAAPKTAFLTLQVPAGAKIVVKGGTGTVHATGMTNSLDITMVGGSVTIEDVKLRALSVDALDASITVTGNSEWMRLKSDAGDIVMRGRSPDAAFNSTTGNVRVDATLERASFNSTTGSLTWAGDLARGASVKFDTHSGPIDIALDGKTPGGVHAETMNGMIENLMSKDAPKPGRGGRGLELDIERPALNGLIEISTYSGKVRVAGR